MGKGHFPAFPIHPNAEQASERGMSLRDRIAIEAMATAYRIWIDEGYGPSAEMVAKKAYEIADAMLKCSEEK